PSVPKSTGIKPLSARAACVIHLMFDSIHHTIHGGTSGSLDQYRYRLAIHICDCLYGFVMGLIHFSRRSKPVGIPFATSAYGQQTLDTKPGRQGADIPV